MYLNTLKRINNTVDTRDARHLNMVGSKKSCFDTQDRHLSGGTPEYKLNFGFLDTKNHTLSCMTDVLKGVF